LVGLYALRLVLPQIFLRSPGDVANSESNARPLFCIDSSLLSLRVFSFCRRGVFSRTIPNLRQPSPSFFDAGLFSTALSVGKALTFGQSCNLLFFRYRRPSAHVSLLLSGVLSPPTAAFFWAFIYRALCAVLWYPFFLPSPPRMTPHSRRYLSPTGRFFFSPFFSLPASTRLSRMCAWPAVAFVSYCWFLVLRFPPPY